MDRMIPNENNNIHIQNSNMEVIHRIDRIVNDLEFICEYLANIKG